MADNKESGFIELRKKGKHQNNIRCSKQFTQQLQAMRNKALSVRYELKKTNQITKGYIDYPAKLIIMFPNADKYVKHSEN